VPGWPLTPRLCGKPQGPGNGLKPVPGAEISNAVTYLIWGDLKKRKFLYAKTSRLGKRGGGGVELRFGFLSLSEAPAVSLAQYVFTQYAGREPWNRGSAPCVICMMPAVQTRKANEARIQSVRRTSACVTLRDAAHDPSAT
jgi:hypothetical protein